MQSSKVGEYTVYYENVEEFRIIRREIFTEHSYYIDLESEAPTILDVGAHIGMATLYFKKLYPAAKITSVEPHPANFALLARNVAENQLVNVTLVPAAVAPKAGTLMLYAGDSSTGWLSTVGVNEGGWEHNQTTKPFTVPAVTLDSLVTGTVDLLKMDVEGAETGIVRASSAALSRVQNIVMEYHPTGGHDEAEMVAMLAKLGYAVEVMRDPVERTSELKLIWGRRQPNVKA